MTDRRNDVKPEPKGEINVKDQLSTPTETTGNLEDCS